MDIVKYTMIDHCAHFAHVQKSPGIRSFHREPVLCDIASKNGVLEHEPWGASRNDVRVGGEGGHGKADIVREVV